MCFFFLYLSHGCSFFFISRFEHWEHWYLFLFLLHGLQAYVLHEEGRLLELVDPSLGSNYSKEEAMQMLNLAILCTNLSPTLRPSMSTVVSMLEGKMPMRVPTTKSSDSKSMDPRIRSFEEISQESRAQSIPTDEQWFDTSMSGQSNKEEITPLSQSSKLPSDYGD